MKGNLVRRTAIALSAVALTATLGACSQNNSAQPETGGGQEQSSGSVFDDVNSLVSSAQSSLDENKSVVMSLETTGGPTGGSGKMECQVDIEKSQMACTGDRMEFISTPEATYTKIPGLGDVSGKSWTKTAVDPNSPMGAGQMASFQKMTDMKELLPTGSTITNSTKEQVEGQDTTRYEIVTNLTKAVTEADPLLKSSYQLFIDSGVTELKTAIWTNDEDLPVKIESTTPPLNIAGRQTPEMKVVNTYKDWGKPVSITLPPADQVQGQ